MTSESLRANPDTRLAPNPPTAERPPGMTALFGRHHRGAVLVLSGGFLLGAITMYLTTALMPTVVAEIGGQQLYAWATTAYIVASVAGAVLVNQTVSRLGPTRAYLAAFTLFAIGAVACTAAPVMPVFLGGRAVMGLGGGLLAGLGYAMIRRVLPASLWGPGTALISATYGVGTLTGPVLGGVFAEFGVWRAAFAVVGVAGVGLALVAPRALARHRGPAGTVEPIPVLAVVLLAGTAALLSIASVSSGWLLGGLLVAAPVLTILFVRRDRRSPFPILPRSFHQRGSAMRWTLLTTALLTVVVVSEAFAPWFGQTMAGLGPLLAGLLGATVSVGWSFVGLVSSRVVSPRGRGLLIMAGPLVSTLALLGLVITQHQPAGPGLVIIWAVLLIIAGSGIGLAFPQLSVAALQSGTDEQDAGKAAAAIPLVGLIGQSFASALTGLGANSGLPVMADAARNVYLVLLIFTALGVVTAWWAVRLRTSRE